MLKFYYGVMNSGKSATLLMSVYQRENDGQRCIVIKPNENRDGGKIVSRVGLKRDCITFNPEDNLLSLIVTLPNINFKYIYVDECQFLTQQQVMQLWKLSKMGFEVLCFGLKTDFKNELFTSVQSLMVYADKIKAIQPSSTCKHCSAVATTHLLIVDGKPVLDLPSKFEGDIEGTTRFECVCQKCWHDAVGRG